MKYVLDSYSLLAYAGCGKQIVVTLYRQLVFIF